MKETLPEPGSAYHIPDDADVSKEVPPIDENNDQDEKEEGVTIPVSACLHD